MLQTLWGNAGWTRAHARTHALMHTHTCSGPKHPATAYTNSSCVQTDVSRRQEALRRITPTCTGQAVHVSGLSDILKRFCILYQNMHHLMRMYMLTQEVWSQATAAGIGRGGGACLDKVMLCGCKGGTLVGGESVSRAHWEHLNWYCHRHTNCFHYFILATLSTVIICIFIIQHY